MVERYNTIRVRDGERQQKKGKIKVDPTGTRGIINRTRGR